MAVDVLEGLLEEDDEVVQVSSDPAVTGRSADQQRQRSRRRIKSSALSRACLQGHTHNIKVRLFFPHYGSVC